jgi:cytosine/creatinine deaminase
LQGYGLKVGAHADFLLLQAHDAVEALRLRATRLKVVRRGRVLANTAPRVAQLHLAGRPGHVDFTRQA